MADKVKNLLRQTAFIIILLLIIAALFKVLVYVIPVIFIIGTVHEIRQRFFSRKKQSNKINRDKAEMINNDRHQNKENYFYSSDSKVIDVEYEEVQR